MRRSWQSLPPPPHDQKGGTWAAKGFDFTQEEKRGDVAAIRDLCTLAVSRLQAHVDPVGKTGVVMFAGVTEGTDFATYLCEKGLHKDKAAVPERCAAGSPLYNQSYGLRWPMSVTMWRFDGTNAANVTATMKDWVRQRSLLFTTFRCFSMPFLGVPLHFSVLTEDRCLQRNSWAQHAPNMASPAPSPTHEPVKFPGGTYPAAGTGWGQGGGVFGKLLPCDNIPARFKHQRPFPQDSSPEAGWGSRPVTYLDEALDYWRSTAGLPLSKCMASLAKLCGAAQKRGNLQCDLCAAEHAGVMRTAGCSGAEIQNYCSMAV